MNSPDSSNESSLAHVVDQLSLNDSLNHNLDALLEVIQIRYPDIGRISVAVYDHANQSLKSFLSSEGANEPLAHLEVPLEELKQIIKLKTGESRRLTRNLELERASSYTADVLYQKGYLSSYIVPLFDHSRFHGIITYTSQRQDRFDRERTRLQIDITAKLISMMLISELYAIRGLKGTVKTLKEIAAIRDNETGAHLERMSRYSQLIAKQLATTLPLDDEYIEDLYQSAPLHDVGKIAIPDSILLKNGKLTTEEFEVMKQHALLGEDIIQRTLKNLQMKDKSFSRILLNIVHYHHENWDGSGYPESHSGEQIPLEARIIRVADVYDALTSQRPYKKPWSEEETLKYLQEGSGTLFDPDCVQAVLQISHKFRQIAERFSDLLSDNQVGME